MPIPWKVTQVGVGTSVVYTPDAFQAPFAIGIGTQLVTGAATWSVQHTFDDLTGPLGTATVWYNNSGIVNATANLDGNYAFPVTGIRLNVSSTNNATATVSMTLIQALDLI